jgi:GNAT superfamily N-acetyltransferase
MSEQVVRPMTADDTGAVGELRRAWTEEQAGRPIHDDGFDAAFAAWMERENDHRMTWVAAVDGAVVGMLNMLVFTRMPRPRDAASPGPARQWGYVANVFVLAAHRNRGLGGDLVSAATSHADAAGFARLVLSPSEQSRPLYRRAGFGPTSDLLLRPGPQRS